MDWEESDAGYELRSLHITVINMLNTDILTEIIIAHSRQFDMNAHLFLLTQEAQVCQVGLVEIPMLEKGERELPRFPKLGVIIGILQKANRLDKRA